MKFTAKQEADRKPVTVKKNLRPVKWNPRKGTDINDAILAATVLQTGGKIYTLNSKHYPMPEITVQRAWGT